VNFRRQKSVDDDKAKVIKRTRRFISCQIQLVGGSLRNRLHIDLSSAREIRIKEKKKTNLTGFGYVWQRPL